MSRRVKFSGSVLFLVGILWLTAQVGSSVARPSDLTPRAFIPVSMNGYSSARTLTPTKTLTPTPTSSPINPSPTRTSTLTVTITSNHTPTRTVTPTPTHTLTVTITSNHTPTRTATRTATRTPTRTVTVTQPAGAAIIADHLHTDVLAIPDAWIAAARQFVVHYAHTSHGSQVLTGLEWLAEQDSKYAIDISVSDVVTISQNTNVLRFYDGNDYGGDNYITPEMYWETEDGLTHTRGVANTGLFDFSLWTWCGQMSYYDDAQVQQYLGAMEQFEIQYPSMRFIFYTGHTDGSEPGSDLWRHNNMVRDYVTLHGKVLFDFADIESYDPSGTFYSTASDACDWCDDWCAAHPTAFSCQNLPETDTECAHTHGLQCTLKGQAFWWLMARLAGWDGTPAP